MMKSFLASLLVLISSLAHANLESIDFLKPGDALITYDTVSGLYWLDLTYTSTGAEKNTQMSYPAIQEQTQTLGNPLFGFTHATLDQVRDLYTNAGMTISNDGKYHPDNSNATRAYLQLTGVTYDINTRTKRQLGYTSTICNDVRVLNFKTCPNLPTYDDSNLIAAVGLRDGSAFADLAIKAVDVSDTIDVHTGHYLVTHYNPTKIVVAN